MAKILESKYIGMKYNRLTILEFSRIATDYSRLVIAKCDCGVIKEYRLPNIVKKNAKTTSCGCARRKIVGDRMRKNGLSDHPLRGVYDKIKNRCYCLNSKDYPSYGARGVRMSEEWRNDFEAFYKWATANGWKKGMHIDKDKIAKQKGIPPLLYSAETCLILTSKENGLYTRKIRWLKYNGEEMPMKEWAFKLNLNYDKLKYRLKKCNWDMEIAVQNINKDDRLKHAS